ncbi:MAG: phenylalanyl-tRNA synthetase, beta subunit [Myxococcales bacterium]|nr:phenylalanyl-tRNA synthetase, beta subunit [Myxococcales bacterium]
MKVSLNWLRELVDAPLDADEVANRLTLAGLEVEAREKFAPLSGVVVARVLAKRPHPDAAKLSLVDVDDGRGKTQVVCGAQNVPAAGGLVLWARPGATLPGGITLGEKPVRGIVSPGMLCAEDELGLGTSHEGILILSPADGLEPGDDFAKKLGLPDEVWEINVTPNRPDCLGHVGVAREVAALLGARLRLPSVPALTSSAPPAKVELADAEGCPRYTALVVEGVTVKPSPLAVRLRLGALGVRAISNVVDATNIMMLLWSQPLHAFDLDKLGGGGVLVRRARAGEKLMTLDDQERTLGPDDVVIADADGTGVAIGGVMGGGGSEVSSATTRLFLESAHFLPSRVRRTAKRLGLHTEAAHRFERGTDPSNCAHVARHLAATIMGVAGGKLGSSLTDAYPRPIAPVLVTLRPARTDALLGFTTKIDRQVSLLKAIGIDAIDEGAGTLRALVPTSRPDLTREVDLIEEIARLHGYDHVPATLPPLDSPPGPMRDADDVRNDAARDALRGLGLDEVVTYGFVGPEALRVFGGDEKRWVRVTNPLREEQSIMRTTLVPGLCAALARNLARDQPDVRIFEVGGIFRMTPGHPNPAEERWHAAALLHGRADGWLKPGTAVDFYDLKGAVEQLLEALGHAGEWQASKQPWLHPGIQAEIHIGGVVVGYAGQLHPAVTRALSLGAAPLVFELDLQALPAASAVVAMELPRFPAVARDLSFYIDESVTARAIREVIDGARDPLCVGVRVLEEYRGDKRPAGKKGMLWSFTYRAPDRTLTDAEVQKLHDELVARLAAKMTIERR